MEGMTITMTRRTIGRTLVVMDCSVLNPFGLSLDIFDFEQMQYILAICSVLGV
jgi:hypothetical protein